MKWGAADLATELLPLGSIQIFVVTYHVERPNCLLRIDGFEAFDKAAARAEVKRLKAADREERRLATLSRKMWEAAHGIKRGKTKRKPRRDAPEGRRRTEGSDTADDTPIDSSGDGDAEGDGSDGVADDDAPSADSDHGGGGHGGGGGGDGGGGAGGVFPVIRGADGRWHDPASDTAEEHDVGVPSDGGAAPIVVPVVPAVPVALPNVYGEKVHRVPDGKWIGNIWWFWDDGGNKSLITHCRYHTPPCKKRTTARKQPDYDSAMRWIAAGRYMTRQDHSDAYEPTVLPPEFHSKPKA